MRRSNDLMEQCLDRRGSPALLSVFRQTRDRKRVTSWAWKEARGGLETSRLRRSFHCLHLTVGREGKG